MGWQRKQFDKSGGKVRRVKDRTREQKQQIEESQKKYEFERRKAG